MGKLALRFSRSEVVTLNLSQAEKRLISPESFKACARTLRLVPQGRLNTGADFQSSLRDYSMARS